MRYMGSKRAHFKEYYPVIEKFRQPGQAWVEPFVGGANSIDKVPGLRIANDLHPHLIAMWRALQDGWEPPGEVSELEYNRLKKIALRGADPDPLLGFVGFGCAFGGLFFDTYARDDYGDNYALQTKNSVLKQIQTMPKNEVIFFNGSYDQLPIPPNSFIYCDPPYADTAGYSVGGFDHRKFWRWANRKIAEGHTVFVAEYTAPPDWVPIWTKKVRGKLLAVDRLAASVEKIFTRAMTYDEEAAREYYDPPLHKFFSLKQVLHFLAPACRDDDSHVIIDNLRATASTRTLTISAPINIEHDVKPQAKMLTKAIKIAEDSRAPVVTSLTKAGKLSVKAGKQTTFIECATDYDMAQAIKPSGDVVPNASGLVQAFKVLMPFIGEDELRPDQHGLMISDKSVYAVNNIICAQYWTGIPVTTPVIVSRELVKMVVALDEEPESVQVSENTVTFWYPGERRITSTLIDATWPIARVDELLSTPANPVQLPDDFFDGVEAINNFSDERESLYIHPDHMATSLEDEIGSRVDIATGAEKLVCFTAYYLYKLRASVTHIDWSMWPKPCVFRGDRLRGVIIGRAAPNDG